jgi:hypothetical protein
LLNLTIDEIETLDETLAKRAACLRVVLKMFLRANRRFDLDAALPRRHRPKQRMPGLDETLMPEDVISLIAAAGSKRDRALIAVMAQTGGRPNEVLALRLRDMKRSNGIGYQMWFGTTKVRGQERFSPRIEGIWKEHVDTWLAAHPLRSRDDAWLFVSEKSSKLPLNDKTLREMLPSIARKAGVSKKVNPREFRNARATWAAINKEDTTTICTQLWGVPITPMWNRYSRFRGLDMTIGEPVAREMPDVPALPEVRTRNLVDLDDPVVKEKFAEAMLSNPLVVERLAGMFMDKVAVRPDILEFVSVWSKFTPEQKAEAVALARKTAP